MTPLLDLLLSPFRVVAASAARQRRARAAGRCMMCEQRPPLAGLDLCGPCWNDHAAAP